MNIVNIPSEVRKLKRMIVHRPGEELNNLVPNFLEMQLFDDTPYLSVAQREHDEYVRILQGLGIDVLYIRDLIAESVSTQSLKDELVERFVEEANIYGDNKKQAIKEYLLSLENKKMVDVMISGLRKSDLKFERKHLSDFMTDEYPFILDPMPNMYFTRDPFSFVGKGVIISKMFKRARSRETLFGAFVMEHHSLFKDVPIYYNRNDSFSIEGGDIMMLKEDTLAIGVSQRTNVNAVEEVAKRLLFDEESGFKKILAIEVPKTRSYMHLDTVFTMVDYGKFTIHPSIENEMKIYAIEKKEGKLSVNVENLPFKEALKKQLELDKITLINCGGNSYVDSAREQWNDGANTLAVAPNEIIVYTRNVCTNKLLVDNGIKIHEIPCSELSRGRGGPHCMSMAVTRI
ncbi:MAG: arginine deiminase [Clostridia bacterium]